MDAPGAAGRDDAKTPAWDSTQAGFVWSEPMNTNGLGQLRPIGDRGIAYHQYREPGVKEQILPQSESETGGKHAAL